MLLVNEIAHPFLDLSLQNRLNQWDTSADNWPHINNMHCPVTHRRQTHACAAELHISYSEPFEYGCRYARAIGNDGESVDLHRWLAQYHIEPDVVQYIRIVVRARRHHFSCTSQQCVIIRLVSSALNNIPHANEKSFVFCFVFVLL